MLTPEQSRAARAWLDWTQAELAERAGVSRSTIKAFEGKSHEPIGNNLKAIRQALEAGGIEFLFDAKKKAVGVAVAGAKLVR